MIDQEIVAFEVHAADGEGAVQPGEREPQTLHSWLAALVGGELRPARSLPSDAGVAVLGVRGSR